jgi:hypothetical protein
MSDPGHAACRYCARQLQAAAARVMPEMVLTVAVNVAISPAGNDTNA